MRKQYYFRPSPAGLLAWDVDRLVSLSRTFPVRAVPLSEIRELDEAMFDPGDAPTWRSFAGHVRLVQESDLSYPIILAADGAIMDGRHRVTRAVMEGRQTIDAVQFAVDPDPDYIGCRPDELPYEEERDVR